MRAANKRLLLSPKSQSKHCACALRQVLGIYSVESREVLPVMGTLDGSRQLASLARCLPHQIPTVGLGLVEGTVCRVDQGGASLNEVRERGNA